MEEENPLETKEGLDEVNEHAEGAKEKGQGWVRFLSISTAIIAVLAALATLMSGHYSNEALLLKNDAILSQTRASDQWSYYQAKGIKREVAAEFAAQKPTPQLAAKIEQLDAQQKVIGVRAQKLEKEADAKNEESSGNLEHHHKLAISVTLFQIAIALSAIAALLRRRRVWLLSLVGAAVGLAYLIGGMR